MSALDLSNTPSTFTDDTTTSVRCPRWRGLIALQRCVDAEGCSCEQRPRALVVLKQIRKAMEVRDRHELPRYTHCVICKAELNPDSSGYSRNVCGAKCRRERRRFKQRAWDRKTGRPHR